jgi:bifunctional oligoribonuclease and PAP phosphatase NrnA
MNSATQAFKQLLKTHNRFLLSSHIDPDGDGLGGCLALEAVLRSLGKQVCTVLSSPVSDRYKFLPGSESILSEFPSDLGGSKSTVLITVDAPNLARLGFKEGELSRLDPIVVNIDHHTSNEHFGDIVILDESSSASCEVIFYLCRELEIDLSWQSATNLYTGLLTDTGRFRFSNTVPATFEAARALLEAGAEHNQVVRKLFDERPYARVALEGKVLNTLQRSGPIAWVVCTLQMMEESGTEDTEELVNRLTEIKDLELAFLFKEVSSQRTKVSLRARGDIDVNVIASQFGGGGHAKAAGARLDHDLAASVKELLSKAEDALRMRENA